MQPKYGRRGRRRKRKEELKKKGGKGRKEKRELSEDKRIDLDSVSSSTITRRCVCPKGEERNERE